VPIYDAECIFDFRHHTKGEDRGSLCATGFSDPALDERIQALASEIDTEASDGAIAGIWHDLQAQHLYLPIHHQVLNWDMADRVGIDVSPEDDPKFRYFTVGGRPGASA
jgi:peptide/nickel transport system substrate-binding protein